MPVGSPGLPAREVASCASHSCPWPSSLFDGDRLRILGIERRLRARATGPAAPPADVSAHPAPRHRPYDGNTFKDPGKNPVTDTDEDHVSTFAMDVDTASYTIAQRYVADGNVPDPASVRVEEWVNAFDQGYEPPRKATFAIVVDGAPTPFSRQDEVLLRVGIQARQSSERARPDAALTFVIDTSGSMERDGRLELVKDSLRKLVTFARARRLRSRSSRSATQRASS